MSIIEIGPNLNEGMSKAEIWLPFYIEMMERNREYFFEKELPRLHPIAQQLDEGELDPEVHGWTYEEMMELIKSLPLMASMSPV